MEKFMIVAGGTCDLGPDLEKKKRVKVLPFYVSLNGKDYYKEEVELTNEAFYTALLRDAVTPKTSTPAVEDFLNAFKEGAQKGLDILCCCATETLTSAMKTAEAAKNILLESYPDANVGIINSDVMTVAEGLFVMEAAKLRDRGCSVQETMTALEAIKADSRIFFFTGGLKYLQKGGRIGKVAAVATNILSIKPLIELADGEITAKGIIRSRKAGLKKVVEMAKNYINKMGEPAENFVYSIGATFDVRSDVAELTNLFMSAFGFIPDYPHMPIGSTVGSHTGPGTIGIGITKKV